MFILITMIWAFGCATKQDSTPYKEDIRNIIKSSKPKLKICYDEAVKSDSTLEGTLISKFSINQTGQVDSSDVDLEKSTIKNQAMIECVKKEIKELKFADISPEVAKRDITFPFVFNKEDKNSSSK